MGGGKKSEERGSNTPPPCCEGPDGGKDSNPPKGETVLFPPFPYLFRIREASHPPVKLLHPVKVHLAGPSPGAKRRWNLGGREVENRLCSRFPCPANYL